jgi:hypothetical protein
MFACASWCCSTDQADVELHGELQDAVAVVLQAIHAQLLLCLEALHMPHAMDRSCGVHSTSPVLRPFSPSLLEEGGSELARGGNAGLASHDARVWHDTCHSKLPYNVHFVTDNTFVPCTCSCKTESIDACVIRHVASRTLACVGR